MGCHDSCQSRLSGFCFCLAGKQYQYGRACLFWLQFGSVSEASLSRYRPCRRQAKFISWILVLLNLDEKKWPCRAEVVSYALQGKYINDPEVLREAAHAAGVEDYEKVLSDPMHTMDQVHTFTSVAVHIDCSCFHPLLHLAQLPIKALGIRQALPYPVHDLCNMLLCFIPSAPLVSALICCEAWRINCGIPAVTLGTA